MKWTTFINRQGKRFDKFVEKRETAKNKHEYIIADVNGELWFGNQCALSRVICEEFNESICGNFSFLNTMLYDFKRNMQEYTPATVTEGSIEGKKAWKLTTPYGNAIINPKLLPEMPSGAVYMVYNDKPERTPVWVICNDVVIGLICPIIKAKFVEG